MKLTACLLELCQTGCDYFVQKLLELDFRKGHSDRLFLHVQVIKFTLKEISFTYQCWTTTSISYTGNEVFHERE